MLSAALNRLSTFNSPSSLLYLFSTKLSFNNASSFSIQRRFSSSLYLSRMLLSCVTKLLLSYFCSNKQQKAEIVNRLEALLPCFVTAACNTASLLLGRVCNAKGFAET
jgi:hypothetical protein